MEHIMKKRQPDDPIRVVIAEDSIAQRELLIGLLQQSQKFLVVGTASNGREAVEMTLRTRPDVIAMDIHMPVLDGYEATRLIMQKCPTPIVMISNSIGDESRRSMDALAAGALAVLRKPGALTNHTHDRELHNLLTTLRLMADVPLVTRYTRRTPAPLPIPSPQQRTRVLAIAASTGGPAAVQMILAGLAAPIKDTANNSNGPPLFPLPILLVQHIARGFVDALVDWLNSTVPLTVQVARHRELMRPGHVYVAPDEHHLLAGYDGTIALRQCTEDDRYCPDADILFESVATTYASAAVGVILTGMGDDGAEGLRLLHAAGGHTLAQDEASCIVYGMPKAAVQLNAVSQVVALAAMSQVIRDYIGTQEMTVSAQTGY